MSENNFNPYPATYTLRIKINPTNPNYEFLENYYKGLENKEEDGKTHKGDSGIDLVTPELYIIHKKNQQKTIDLGISAEMLNQDEYHVSYYLYPRSSFSNTPLALCNSVGIIDAGYRGNLMARVRNTSSERDYDAIQGSRLFQICAPDLKPIRVKVIGRDEELSNTTRNTGGFGSTGF